MASSNLGEKKRWGLNSELCRLTSPLARERLPPWCRSCRRWWSRQARGGRPGWGHRTSPRSQPPWEGGGRTCSCTSARIRTAARGRTEIFTLEAWVLFVCNYLSDQNHSYSNSFKAGVTTGTAWVLLSLLSTEGPLWTPEGEVWVWVEQCWLVQSCIFEFLDASHLIGLEKERKKWREKLKICYLRRFCRRGGRAGE